MKLTITNIEVSPSEVSEVPELREILARLSESIGERAGDGEHERSADIWQFIDLRGRENSKVGLVKQFVERVLEFADTEYVLGRSKQSPDGLNDYLYLRHTNHRYGGFVYVTPSNGRLVFRLMADRANGFGHVKVADVKDNYQLRVFLDSEGALEDAVELARMAYDDVTD